LDRAVQLAKDHDARLVALHVLSGASASPSFASEPAEMRAREALERALARSGVAYEVRIARGDVVEAISSAARQTGADLIVTGVARFNDLGDLVLGNPVDRLVKTAPAPVLVVKGRTWGSYRAVCVATDSAPPAKAALHAAAGFFPQADFRLVKAFHVAFQGLADASTMREEVANEEKAKLEAFLKSANLPADILARTSTILAEGEPCAVLSCFVRDRELELAVVGTHGRSGLREAMIGSTAKALLECLPCDVLMVRGG